MRRVLLPALWLLAPRSIGSMTTGSTTSQVNRYFMATTISGGEKVLATEISSLRDVHSVVEAKAQVFFQGSEATGLEAIMRLRTSLRVLERLADGEDVNTKEDLHAFVGSFDWASVISCEQTIKVDVTLGQASQELSHTHFSALTVKNAVVDQFRSRFNKRPSIDTEDPDLPLLLYLHRGRALLYRAWSGEGSMHKRGYRETVHRAALRETTAAALVLLTDWTAASSVLCDPMCGSGTIPIEAALIAATCSPGLLRYSARPPAAIRWGDLEDASRTWGKILGAAERADQRREMGRGQPLICANDIHPGAVGLAKQAARAAGVDRLISFANGDAGAYAPPVTPSVAITNPPWDLRLDGAPAAWEALGAFAKREMSEGVVWALSGNPEVSRHSRLKASLKIPLKAAAVDMRLLRYDIRVPSFERST